MAEKVICIRACTTQLLSLVRHTLVKVWTVVLLIQGLSGVVYISLRSKVNMSPTVLNNPAWVSVVDKVNLRYVTLTIQHVLYALTCMSSYTSQCIGISIRNNTLEGQIFTTLIISTNSGTSFSYYIFSGTKGVLGLERLVAVRINSVRGCSNCPNTSTSSCYCNYPFLYLD